MSEHPVQPHSPPKVTFSGLMERRATLAAQLEEAQEQVAILTAFLRIVDRRIRWAGANHDAGAIQPRRLRLAAKRGQRGPIVRPLLAILRAAGEPLPLRVIVLGMMEHYGMDTGDKRLLRNVSHQVRLSLAAQQRHGVVRCERGTGVVGRWGIVR